MKSKIHYTEIKSGKKFLELWDQLSKYKRRYDIAEIAKRMNLTPARISTYIHQTRTGVRKSIDLDLLELLYNHLATIVQPRIDFIKEQKEDLQSSLSNDTSQS